MSISGVPNGWNGRRARQSFEELFASGNATLPEWIRSIARARGRRPTETHFVATLDVGDVYLCVKPTKIGVARYQQAHPGEGVGFYMNPYYSDTQLQNALFSTLGRRRQQLQMQPK
jgi:hypothetical protein